MSEQPRWPRGTPVGPGGRGPGGGRFRGADGGITGSGIPSAPGGPTGRGGRWAQQISDSIGRRSAPSGGRAAGGSDNYDERLLEWESQASEYMRSVENMRDDEINDFWEWVALTGGAGPDDDGDPEDWAARVLPEFYDERDDDEMRADVDADIDYQQRLLEWEDRASAELRRQGLSDGEIEEFWGWVALEGGAGPDDGDPVGWVSMMLPEFFERSE